MPQAQPNRLLDATLLHAVREAQYRVDNPAAQRKDPHSLDLQRRHYESIVKRYRRRGNELTPTELSTRRFLKHEIRRIKALQDPNYLTAILYNRIVNWLFNAALGRQQNYTQQKKNLAGYENKTVTDTNVNNLLKKLNGAGFKNIIESPLRQHLAHMLPEFSIRYFDIEKPDTDYVLHFKKIKDSDAYYFEKVDATYRPDVESFIRNESSPSMVTVSMVEKIPFNAEDARHLAVDRPVQKTVAGEPVWVMNDPASAIGVKMVQFDPWDALKDWPIKELDTNDSLHALLKDLNTGKEHAITLPLPSGIDQSLNVSLGPNANRDDLQLVFRAKDGTLVDADGLMAGQSLAEKVFHQLEQRTTLQVNMHRPMTLS